jgi:hypothetical protein
MPKDNHDNNDWLHKFKDVWRQNIDVYLMWVILLLVVLGTLVGLWLSLVKLKTGLAGLDIAIQVALLSFVGSSIGFLLSKRYDLKCRLREQLITKRRMVYEEIVSFLFECQQREGYNVALSSIEVEQRCSKVTQKVLLWASEPIQIGWNKYLYFRHNGKGGQLIIGTILYDIGREMGYKYNNAFFAYHRPLEFFYGCNSVTISLDKNNEKI